MTDTDAGTGTGRRREMTVAMLARLAGVSAPTVSRVLNGQAGVALSTRERVEEVIRQHGYRRPEGSERLAVLELVFHALDSPWALEIIQGVEQVARDNALAVVLTEMEGRLTPGKAWTEQVLTRRPTGVIAVFSELTVQQQSQLATRSIPLVVLDPTGEPLHETPSVGATNWNGGLAATRHLIELGHRRIAMLSGPTGWPCIRARLDGYRAAMDSAGLPGRPGPGARIDPVRRGRSARRRGAAAPARPADRHLRRDRPAGDGRVPGGPPGGRAHPAGPERGRVRRPAVRALVGAPLTTVRQPLVRMGAAAAEMVLALARGEPLADNRMELATTLMVRESTAALRSETYR